MHVWRFESGEIAMNCGHAEHDTGKKLLSDVIRRASSEFRKIMRQAK
jgi:hypothetical protein